MAASSQAVEKNVSELFDAGFQIFNDLSKTYEATNTFHIQALVKKSITLLEESTKLVSLAGIFASNESVDEIPSTEIKFFLLPALLGTLTLKLCGPMLNRLEVVNTAIVYFQDFLIRCKDYNIIDFELPMPNTEVVQIGADGSVLQAFNLSRMACQRNIKIKRFYEQKEMDKQLQDLQAAMVNLHVDEDTKRDYYMTLIKSFANQAIDELDCLYCEKPIIEHRASVQVSEIPEKPEKNHTVRSPLLPIVIGNNNMKIKAAENNDTHIPAPDRELLDTEATTPKDLRQQEAATSISSQFVVKEKKTGEME